MTFFCLLWVPCFYLLRRALNDGGNSSGGVWALILGSITAIVQFLLGYIFSPGGFGLSRLVFGFFEIVSMPVLIPFIAYLLMFIFHGFSSDADFADFSLLWLIPVAALRALSWSSLNDPILLIMAPLLWTALAVGISFLIKWMSNTNIFFAILAILCMILLPIAAAGTYWAFFSQQILLGFGLLLVTHVPFGLSFALLR